MCRIPFSGKVWWALSLMNWLALSRYWRNLNLTIWILSAIGTHAIIIIYIAKFFIWQPLLNLPNCQIKNFAKVSSYIVVLSYHTVRVHIYLSSSIPNCANGNGMEWNGMRIVYTSIWNSSGMVGSDSAWHVASVNDKTSCTYSTLLCVVRLVRELGRDRAMHVRTHMVIHVCMHPCTYTQ